MIIEVTAVGLGGMPNALVETMQAVQQRRGWRKGHPGLFANCASYSCTQWLTTQLGVVHTLWQHDGAQRHIRLGVVLRLGLCQLPQGQNEESEGYQAHG